MQDQPTFVKSFAIEAYDFRADRFCGGCIQVVLPEDERYDGWALTAPITMAAEDNLDEMARAFGIDREDESSFDSADFPKVVFADEIEDGDRCGRCGGDL